MEENNNSRKRRVFLGLAIGLSVGLVCLVAWLVGKPLIAFISQPEKFRQWVDSMGIWGRLAFVGMVMLQIVVAIIPGEPFEIAAGYAFGAFEGTALAMLAATLGSVMVFALVRRWGMKFVGLFFSQEKLRSVRFLHTNSKREFLFLVIFMIPGTPKDLLCYFAGLTDMRFPVWLMICSLGRIPSIITSTIGGDALGTQNYWGAILSFAIAMALSGAGMLLYNRICKSKNKE